MCLLSLPIALLLLQSVEDISAYNQLAPRKVKQIYWQETKTTEVIVNLLPEGPKGEKPLLRLIFQAFIPGREAKGSPARLFVRAMPLPLTVGNPFAIGSGGVALVPPSRLCLASDGETVDLGPEGSQRLIDSCPIASDRPCPLGIEVEIKPAVSVPWFWEGAWREQPWDFQSNFRRRTRPLCSNLPIELG